MSLKSLDAVTLSTPLPPPPPPPAVVAASNAAEPSSSTNTTTTTAAAAAATTTTTTTTTPPSAFSSSLPPPPPPSSAQRQKGPGSTTFLAMTDEDIASQTAVPASGPPPPTPPAAHTEGKVAFCPLGGEGESGGIAQSSVSDKDTSEETMVKEEKEEDVSAAGFTKTSALDTTATNDMPRRRTSSSSLSGGARATSSQNPTSSSTTTATVTGLRSILRTGSSSPISSCRAANGPAVIAVPPSSAASSAAAAATDADAGGGTADHHAGGRSRAKITGIYAGDLIPGQYIRTLTGTRRGEELFCRPDVERPWRSTQQQRHAMQVAHKEEEIEALMRLCSDLRTELGNVRADAREMEFAVQERAKRQLAKKDEMLDALRKELADARAAQSRAKEDAEHQIRLLKSQHENERHQLTTEVRLANEKMVEQAKAFDQQTREIKAVAAREVELMETRFRVRVEELEAELKAQRASATAAQAHYDEQMTHTKALLSKVEAEFRERARAAEQKSEEMRQTFDRAIEREREEKRAAQGEVRAAAEKLAAAVVDAEEVLHRYQLWNQFILSALDAHQSRFAEMCPEHVVVVNDPRQHDLPGLYTPRVLQQQPDAKLTVERIVLRLLELELNPIFPEDTNERNKGALSDGHGVAEAEAQHISDRQQRLRSGMRELEERCRDLDRVVSALRTRLCFFSDDLHQSLSVQYPQVEPPPANKVTFVCLSIYEGNQLWSTQPELMHTAVSYFLSTLRSKKREYGAYECYADGVCVLLACEDPIAACRLALDVQEWCLKLPWPEGLRRHPACCPLYSHPSTAVANRLPSSPASSSAPTLLDGAGAGAGAVGADGAALAGSSGTTNNQTSPPTLLFDGLRIAAAIHTGPCQLEATAMPESRYVGSAADSSHFPSSAFQAAHDDTTTNPSTPSPPISTAASAYRQHFYGRAVLQTIHICSLAQGGQIMVSQPVWNGSAQSRRHELSALAVARSLGRYAILSMNPQLGQEESQTMELFQIMPTTLAARQFVPTSLLLQQAHRQRRGVAVPPPPPSDDTSTTTVFKNGLVTGLDKVKNFTIAVAVAGLDHQHGAVQEGLKLLRTELREVQDKSAAMLEKARKAKAHFHLLPPPEMVLQLNELYHILEEVAGLSEESSEDMKQLEVAQDELRASMQGVREYLYRYLSDSERESAMKVEHEATLNRMDGMLREVQTQRKREIDALQLAVGERDQALRRMYQQQQQQLGILGVNTMNPGAGGGSGAAGGRSPPPPPPPGPGRSYNNNNHLSLPVSSTATPRQVGVGTPKLNTPGNTRNVPGSRSSTTRY